MKIKIKFKIYIYLFTQLNVIIKIKNYILYVFKKYI